MLKRILVVLATLICLAFSMYGLFLLSKSRTFQLAGKLVSHKVTEKKVVALTFDDAPSPYSDAVLRILKEKKVKATFYMIGKNIDQFPTEAKNIVLNDHELGNHSYSHERMVLKSPEFIDSEIQRTNTAIRDLGYSKEITFRPPNGKKLLFLPLYLNSHNITTVMWDVEPDTYFSGNGDALVKYTLERTRPGSIILLHPFCGDKCEADRKALSSIIDGLKNKGYEFVTVSELMNL